MNYWREILSMAACILLVGCLSQSIQAKNFLKEKKESESDVISENYFYEQRKCYAEWNSLLQGWKKEGGGVRESMGETRRISIKLNRSNFAKGVKKAWRQQKKDGRQVFFPTWPISEEQYRYVMFSTLEAFSGYVSAECESTSWLGPILWDELRVPGEARISNSRFKDMPEKILADPKESINWLMYGIFSSPAN
ncbi:hypothetical protein [Dokdonella ginsengisoli]|uniref:Lipoprotein n=1 Tax=Dokdonella ginsengisoli TaxID=363846 RepID=A0ABV9QRG3_9GAMM